MRSRTDGNDETKVYVNCDICNTFFAVGSERLNEWKIKMHGVWIPCTQADVEKSDICHVCRKLCFSSEVQSLTAEIYAEQKKEIRRLKDMLKIMKEERKQLLKELTEERQLHKVEVEKMRRLL